MEEVTLLRFSLSEVTLVYINLTPKISFHESTPVNLTPSRFSLHCIQFPSANTNEDIILPKMIENYPMYYHKCIIYFKEDILKNNLLALHNLTYKNTDLQKPLIIPQSMIHSMVNRRKKTYCLHIFLFVHKHVLNKVKWENSHQLFLQHAMWPQLALPSSAIHSIFSVPQQAPQQLFLPLLEG